MAMRKFAKDNYLNLTLNDLYFIGDNGKILTSENIIQSSTDSSVKAIKFQLSSFEAHLSVDGCCCNFPESYMHVVMHI